MADERASSEADSDEPGSGDELDAELRALYRAIEEREAKPYDGIVGTLPDWMPEPLRVEFYAIRADLLEHHDVREVRRWMRAFRVFKCRQERLARVYEAEGDVNESLPTPAIRFPIELRRELSALVYIRGIFSLGKVEAIPAYLGEGPHRIYREAVLAPVSQRDQERRLTGIKKSAEVRKAANAGRDRRIHDAHAAGLTPKQIADDKQIVGDKELSVSTVNRILKRPRP